MQLQTSRFVIIVERVVHNNYHITFFFKTPGPRLYKIMKSFLKITCAICYVPSHMLGSPEPIGSSVTLLLLIKNQNIIVIYFRYNIINCSTDAFINITITINIWHIKIHFSRYVSYMVYIMNSYVQTASTFIIIFIFSVIY